MSRGLKKLHAIIRDSRPQSGIAYFYLCIYRYTIAYVLTIDYLCHVLSE